MRFIFTGSEEENLEYNKKKLYASKDCVLGCISDEAGAVFASGDLSYINTDYKTSESENIFVNRRNVKCFVQKILTLLENFYTFFEIIFLSSSVLKLYRSLQK